MSSPKKQRLTRLGAALAAAALVVVVAILVSSGGGAKKPAASGASLGGGAVAGLSEVRRQLAGIPQHGPVLGRKDAPTVLVEAADLQCPFCREASMNLIPQVIRDGVRTGKVRLVFRDLAFLGDDSDRLARAAAAAGLQGHYWDAVELLYRNQGQENSGYATDDYLRRVLSKIPGLNVDRAMRDRSSPQVAQLLGEARTLASRYGVRSTPTFLVGRSEADLHQVSQDKVLRTIRGTA
jgi:protein-disulfide isomerase